ncbi:pentapeptide repeat-containing protein [uncultured Paenibacillus sp.]|uniref:pentapeptide repeat-containing protein n=1 Tax=uncultured Paenibacillus sp. TaxID=227322 RepID=UPI0015B1BFDB|nr:pentapeptide repeat-containing protein [uncultured Paenibacillus sp.]
MFQHHRQNYSEVNFSGQDMRYGELTNCTFTRCSFANGVLDEINSINCRFVECDFQGASLNGSIHNESAFENCNFSRTNLFCSKFVTCKMTGSDFTDSTLDGFTISKGDWSYTILRNARLVRQDLREVRFLEVDFSGANLEKADLRGADLTLASFSKAKLHGADVRGANMNGVDFKAFTISGMRLDKEQAILYTLSHGAKVD